MRAFLAIWCLLAGIAAAYYFQAATPIDHEQQVAAVTRIIAESPLDPPAEAVVPDAPAHDAGAAHGLPAVAARVAAAIDPAETGVVVTPAAVWDTRVSAVEVTPQVTPPALLTPPAQVQAAPPAGKTKSTAEIQLARDIQKELVRLGCYANKPTGAWGEGSRQAMARFLARVNAKLPVNEPDLVLLSLAQAHPAGICSHDCAAGLTLASGRCVPRTVVAASERSPETARRKTADNSERVTAAAANRARQPEQRVAAVEPVAPPRPPLEGRMSIGGPVTHEPKPAEALPWQSEADRSDQAISLAPDSTTHVAVPSAGRAKVRTAALPPSASPSESEVDPPRRNVITSSPAETPRAAARPARAKAIRVPSQKAKKVATKSRKYYSSYRSVQNLFLHPLGRM